MASRPRQIIPTFGYHGQMYMRGPQNEAPLYCRISSEVTAEGRSNVYICWTNLTDFYAGTGDSERYKSFPPNGIIPPPNP